MKFLRPNQSGFSIVEVIVAALVFAITTVGILTTISIFRRPAKISERKLQAALVAQRILEDLRSQVDARNWNDSTSPLSVGSHAFTSGIYSGNYVVTEDANGYRGATITINWTEAP